MSSDTALAPNKKAREICWSYRDKLFECLDKYNDDLSKCTEEIKGVENNCKKMWSKYFLKRRNYLQFREKVEKEGFQYTDPESDKK